MPAPKDTLKLEEWKRKKYSFPKGHQKFGGRVKQIKPPKIKVPWNHTYETRKKMSDSRKGKLNPMWKGGISSENIKLRQSIEYKDWRESVFKRDNYTCQHCGKRGVKLNADHIKPFALYPELRFDINNGRTLCAPCHKIVHFVKNSV